MRVIFLDIDGVLNSTKTIKKFGFDFIDPILVALVARIVRETEAKIVLSSTWRLEAKDRGLVDQALAQHNLEILDQTPYIKRPFKEGEWVRRHEEIQAWLNENPTSKFAIIDDDGDAMIEGSFFQTEEDRGLTVQIAEKIIAHFNG